MYFWRIEKLKAQIIQKKLSDREVLPYFILSVALMTLMMGGMRHLPITDVWDDISTVVNAVLVLLGTIYLYRQNNGDNGTDFLHRYFTIGWVVSIRWFVFYFALMVLAGIVLAFLGVTEGSPLWSPIVFGMNTVALLMFYWRIGHHIKDVAQHLAIPSPFH